MRKALLRLANLRCPSCGATQDWTLASRTVPAMTEDPAAVIDSFACTGCGRALRLERGRGVDRFTLAFAVGGIAAMGSLAALMRHLMPDGPAGFGQVLLVCAAWLAVGAAVLWTSARFLRLEEVP